MGNLPRRHSVDDGDRHTSPGKGGSAAGLSPGRNARSDRDRSDGLGDVADDAGARGQMSPVHLPAAGARALLVAGRSDHAELEALLRGLGYQTVLVRGADQVAAVRDPVALCLIDLRQNGEALRSARAVRTQYPSSVLIGVADPGRP